MVEHVMPVYFLREGIQARLCMVQDDRGREACFQVRDMILAEGLGAKIYIEKPSGLSCWREAEIHGNEVYAEITPQMLAETGTCLGQVQLYREQERVTSFLFRLEVQKSLVDSSVESKDELTVLERLIQEAEAVIQRAEKAGEAAQTAAEKAETSAERADTAAGNAQTAAEKADTASEEANAAAERADTASEGAGTAAGNAETAAKRAEAVYEKLKDFSAEAVDNEIQEIQAALGNTIIVEG